MDDITIDVLMTGGRRCGKTSVLAAMHACLEDLAGNTELAVLPDDSVILDELEKNFQFSNDIFLDRKKYENGFFPDGTPSQDINSYPFRILLKGEKTRFVINFHDYPGEFIKDGSHNEEIKDLFAKSRIVIIAIDTPHMMEESQRFDDRKNLERRIFETFKDVEYLSPSKGPCMVIFVPLKCEKYYHENRMNEVADQVKKSYEKLIILLLETAKQNNIALELAINPILTIGGIKFSHFDQNEDGEIATTKGIPDRPIYKFIDMSQDKPSPKYCEQPVLNILNFINTHKTIVEKGNITNKIIGYACLLLAIWALTKSIILAAVLIIVACLILYFSSTKVRSMTNFDTKLRLFIKSSIKKDGDGYQVL